MTKPTPPGWYPDMADSRGLERYWNGSEWESRFRKKGSTEELTERPRNGSAPSRSSNSKPSNGKAATVGLVVIAGIIWLVASSCSGGSDEESGGGARQAGSTAQGVATQSPGDLIGTRKLVEQTCREAVENRLKSPSSAEFSDVQARQDDSAGTRWTVTGKVDSENSFGASIRNTFTCTSTYDIASETARTSVTSFSGN